MMLETHQLARKRGFFALALTLSLSACATTDSARTTDEVPEIRPGILQGYLPAEAMPNSLDLVPPPPADGSSAKALDEAVSRASLKLRDSSRWELAAEDNNLMFPRAAETFSCAVGAPITEAATPHLYMVLRRSLADAGLSTYTAKNHYTRQRPFLVNGEATCVSEEEQSHLIDADPGVSGTRPSGCDFRARSGVRAEPGSLQRSLAERRHRGPIHGCGGSRPIAGQHSVSG
jgi:hypothetical protein